MKMFSLFIMTTFVTMITAYPMHSQLNYDRYLQEKDTIANELQAWMDIYGTKAQANGWLPPVEARSADAVQEDFQQRFFMAKELVQTLEQRQPHANFTTNSPFTLMTVEEFAAFAQNQVIANQSHAPQRRVEEMFDFVGEGEHPQGVDWALDVCMPPVRNQGPCGTCWAFASIAAVETSRCIALGGNQYPYTFSEQSLAACDQNGVYCQGGNERLALDFVMTTGVCSADEDPYYVKYGNAQSYLNGCNRGCSRKETGLKGYATVYGENGLINALNRHPVIVTVAASPAEFKQYQQGVLASSTCDGWPNDHAVVAVGYDSESFKIRNSWDVSWGEQGYFRLARASSSPDGTCGVYQEMTELEF